MSAINEIGVDANPTEAGWYAIAVDDITFLNTYHIYFDGVSWENISNDFIGHRMWWCLK